MSIRSFSNPAFLAKQPKARAAFSYFKAFPSVGKERTSGSLAIGCSSLRLLRYGLKSSVSFAIIKKGLLRQAKLAEVTNAPCVLD